MKAKLNITRGTNDKPVATEALIQFLEGLEGISGEVFIGYPLIASPDGKYSIDATLVSPSKGVILFDLIEGDGIADYKERQDDLANKVESKLKLHRDLLEGRRLRVPLNVITYGPRINDRNVEFDESHPLANDKEIASSINRVNWAGGSVDVYKSALSAIQNLSGIRKNRSKRDVRLSNSRGAKLKRLEESIATLDHRQNKAVIETVDGVQRIRGLAGSGKTVILALKAAYLHAQHPDWRIAVTFHTRSLKGQFRRLINSFCVEQSGEEPDWTKIRIINAWGASGGDSRDGIYHEYCRLSGSEFLDFRSASDRFGGSDRAFDGACSEALRSGSDAAQVYDAILVDEAQDFSSSFLKICYSMLRPPKRLVYAYDELQNLSGKSLPPPEEIFGVDDHGEALVSFGNDGRQDVILQKCYRNSRPVLVSAHGLGFGIYRNKPEGKETGLVQMFDSPTLWTEIGYHVREGSLEKGRYVVLERTEETSPEFLECHSVLDDLVVFKVFDSEDEQNSWVVQEIQNNLTFDELRHDDIVVINPDLRSARVKTGSIRKNLFEMGIQTHLAGVDTDADVFFRDDYPSVTFTGIYRAKGNESGMVYVINAQDCDGPDFGLATLRNRLFTAITRSKAWVRVVGYGPRMKQLFDEFSELKRCDFVLKFTYPDDTLLSKLRIVHRDLSPCDRRTLEQTNSQFGNIVSLLESERVNPEDLDPELREKLIALLNRGG